ncbi:MAG: hypothetical protein CMC15_16240 [Flavobacteriaceae bacterium]|jgi:hypothetical protein|nr:hypothetical protein [Flavobacteriaceae bacterium]|tara:strand:+ start:519 stop:920 length:402 start_codon:yes stop_codon:yes gene_type:complete
MKPHIKLKIKEIIMDLEAKFLRRNTDPITSHQSAMDILPKVTLLRKKVLQVVHEHPRRTAREYAYLLHDMFPEIKLYDCFHTPNRRLSDLERLGLVEKAEIRKCTDSQKNATTWVITELGSDLIYESMTDFMQ